MQRPTLERYELSDELGQGGMSVVYRANDRQLSRDVAVKVLHRYLARQPEARRRLHREAMAVARLRHRAIVEIYDYSGPEAEDAYIVCELIDGPTLRDWVEAGSAPGPEIALMIGLELAEALAHAHECGIIHRDLKPENVMIGPQGQLKLMDFGIAQILEGHTRLTATGTLVGSPAHMAPEVIDGKPIDHRADIFSLGTLLYWLAVGELPFTAPHPSALFKRILDGEFTPADAACPLVGRRTARLIARCLANDPDARPATAEALASELRAELEAIDLDPNGARLRRLLVDPETERPALDAHLGGVLIETARAAVAERRWAVASDAVNRILAREPEHAEARAILDRLARGERRTLLLRRTAAAAVPLTLAAIVLGTSLERGEAEPPLAVSAAELSLEPTVPNDPPRTEAEAGEPEPTPTPTPTAALPDRPPPPERRPAVKAPRRPRPRRAPLEDAAPAPGPETRSAADPSTAAERAPLAAVTVQIGRGYADVWVDGRLVLDLVFFGRLELEPGRHSVRVVRDRAKILARLGVDEEPRDRPFPQFGASAPREIDVDDDGRLYEVGPNGRRELKDRILRFSVPTSPREAARIDGWISS